MMPFTVIVEFISNHPYQVFVALDVALLLAWALQYLVIRLGESEAELRHRRYRRRAAASLKQLPKLRDDAARIVWLRKVSPYVFEEMLLTALSRQGFRIQRNIKYSGDDGMDGQVWIAGQRWLIQAKRYNRTISAQHVAAFGELTARKQCRGFFIHTGRTGEVSRVALSRYPDIQLISGQRLLQLLAGDRRWLNFHDNVQQLASQLSRTRSGSPSAHL